MNEKEPVGSQGKPRSPLGEWGCNGDGGFAGLVSEDFSTVLITVDQMLKGFCPVRSQLVGH